MCTLNFGCGPYLASAILKLTARILQKQAIVVYRTYKALDIEIISQEVISYAGACNYM